MDIIDTDDPDWMEFWMVVAAYPTYEVSSLGRVRNRETLQIKHQFRVGSRPGTGYRGVRLEGDKVSVHRLVMSTFVENALNKRTVNHKNGNKVDNRLSNLEWATDSENNSHAYATGLKRAARQRPVTQLSMDGEIIASYESCLKAQHATHVCNGNIRHAAMGTYNSAGGFRWEFAN
jgi:HNH endonuclease